MRFKLIFSILVLFLLLGAFLITTTQADTTGVWLRAEDVLGGNETDSATFGSDFEDEYQNFAFFSGTLTIGTGSEDDSLLRFGDDWVVGADIDRFVFDEKDDSIVGIKSGDGYENNTVLNINSDKYAAVDFGDASDNLWGVGKDENNDFYIDESGANRRVEILEGESTRISINSGINLKGGDVGIEENLDIEGSLNVLDDVNISGIIGDNLDLGDNRIENLGEPEEGSDAATSDYVEGIKNELETQLQSEIQSLREDIQDIDLDVSFSTRYVSSGHGGTGQTVSCSSNEIMIGCNGARTENECEENFYVSAICAEPVVN